MNFTYAKERFAAIGATELLLKKANAACMDDLVQLSEKELFDVYLDETDGESLSYLTFAPIRGEDSIIPADPYQALLDGAGKDVDLMIGTTADEYNYFVYDLLDPSPETEGKALSEESKALFSEMMLDGSMSRLLAKCNEEDKANIREFTKMHADEEEFEQKLRLITEISFRSPAIQVAENHAKAGGKGRTYMYYFCKENTTFDWIGACHACELPYVFHNAEEYVQRLSGPVLPELADQVNGAWVSFAASGDPTFGGVVWEEYSPEKRETMFFNNDGTVAMVNDPLAKERKLFSTIVRYYFGL